MNRYTHALAVLFFMSFNAFNRADFLFAPGFLEKGKEQAADRTPNVALEGGGSIKRNEDHADVMPPASAIQCATMSEFQQPAHLRPLYIRTLATVMAAFMNQFWPWWTRRMGRTYTVTTGALPVSTMDLTLTDIGGKRDLQATHELLESMSDSSDTVAFGVSRGAVTTFVALAQRASEGKLLPQVAVLESPYGTFSDVRPSGFGGWLADVVHPANPQYDATTYVEQYPPSVPTLFVTSENDDKVPCSSTRHLAQALANTGHPAVYLLVLKQSQHKNYTWGNFSDIRTYERVAQAFYKHHKIACDESKAEGINLEQYRVYPE